MLPSFDVSRVVVVVVVVVPPAESVSVFVLRVTASSDEDILLLGFEAENNWAYGLLNKGVDD